MEILMKIWMLYYNEKCSELVEYMDETVLTFE